MKLARNAVILLVVQLTIVSSLAAKYLYQRWSCPRVWARTTASDTQLPMRGRYLSLQLVVDGCQSTLPTAKAAQFPRNVDGTPRSEPYWIRLGGRIPFDAVLRVQNRKLVAVKAEGEPRPGETQIISAWPGEPCSEMHLESPVAFYLPDRAGVPAHLAPGQELWVEVTVPPKGAPRPLQLAIKDNGVWKPLAIE